MLEHLRRHAAALGHGARAVARHAEALAIASETGDHDEQVRADTAIAAIQRQIPSTTLR